MELLIESGADLTLKDKSGHTPLALARNCGASEELIAVLTRHTNV